MAAVERRMFVRRDHAASAATSAPEGSANRRGMITFWMLPVLLLGLSCLTLVITSDLRSTESVSCRHAAYAAARAGALAMLSDQQLRYRRAGFEREGQKAQAEAAAAQMLQRYQTSRLFPDPVRSELRFYSGDSRLQRDVPESMEVLILSGGDNEAEVVVHARAYVSLENRVSGFRPQNTVDVPVLPIGIHTQGAAKCWDEQFDRGQGSDRWSWNQQTQRVVRGADGLPELELVFGTVDDGRNAEGADEINAVLCEPHATTSEGTEDRTFLLQDGIVNPDGWTAAGNRADTTLYFPCRADVSSAVGGRHSRNAERLQRLVGQARIVGLIRKNEVTDGKPKEEPGDSDSDADKPRAAAASQQQVTWTRPAAVRILGARLDGSGKLRVLIQPCVLTTPTAVLAADAPPNRYVYSIRTSR